MFLWSFDASFINGVYVGILVHPPLPLYTVAPRPRLQQDHARFTLPLAFLDHNPCQCALSHYLCFPKTITDKPSAHTATSNNILLVPSYRFLVCLFVFVFSPPLCLFFPSPSFPPPPRPLPLASLPISFPRLLSSFTSLFLVMISSLPPHRDHTTPTSPIK